VLAALDRRRRTGEGAFIDLAQYEAGLQFVAPALLDYTLNGVSPRRNGNTDPLAVPHGCFRCRDGRWVVLSCWDDDEWSRLASLIDGASAAPAPGSGTTTGFTTTADRGRRGASARRRSRRRRQHDA
jgi:crotonobetainyl-CoA:carnitine CoA-transferase CaiB-like acyl-CoA transferase